jgi:uncharacterized protein (TIGR01777 family)
MEKRKFVYKTRLSVKGEAVFAWYEAPGAFARLLPPWLSVNVISRQGGINGGTVKLRIKQGPLAIDWTLGHDQYIAGKQFRDYQIEGPFKSWSHVHGVESDGEGTCYLIDTIEYELPEGVPLEFMPGLYIEDELRRLFRYRHRLIALDTEQKVRYGKVSDMKVLVSGSSGMIGARLLDFLSTQGDSVVSLVRPQSQRSEESHAAIVWDPAAQKVDTGRLEGFDAVVHLGGENLASGRWSEARKEELVKSRVDSTRLLSETLAKLKQPPKVFVVASAIGYYGDRGQETLDERSTKGSGFLADLCEQWEKASEPASNAGIRVVKLRLGVVLSTAGGALAKMLLPFQLGAGGEIGNGQQYFSWISLDDVLGAIVHAIHTESLTGPVNVTAPHPVTNKEFTKALGKVLVRPTLIPIPTFGLRALFGEMADECLIAGQKVLPAKLEAADYHFRDTEIESTLRHILGK